MLNGKYQIECSYEELMILDRCLRIERNESRLWVRDSDTDDYASVVSRLFDQVHAIIREKKEDDAFNLTDKRLIDEYSRYASSIVPLQDNDVETRDILYTEILRRMSLSE